MEISFTPMTRDDSQPVLDILNYYIANTFAAYPENELSGESFPALFGVEGYPSVTVRSGTGTILGFGRLLPYRDIPVFLHTAVVTYFLSPDTTGRGIGAALLNYLERKGAELGISTLLAHISSRNPGSLKFHRQNGFTECGRFIGVGKKNGCFFDQVWMQKTITSSSRGKMEAGDESLCG